MSKIWSYKLHYCFISSKKIVFFFPSWKIIKFIADIRFKGKNLIITYPLTKPRLLTRGFTTTHGRLWLFFFHPNIPTTQHTTLSKLCCFRRSQILVYSMMWYSLYRYIQYSYGVGRYILCRQSVLWSLKAAYTHRRRRSDPGNAATIFFYNVLW